MRSMDPVTEFWIRDVNFLVRRPREESYRERAGVGWKKKKKKRNKRKKRRRRKRRRRKKRRDRD